MINEDRAVKIGLGNNINPADYADDNYASTCSTF